MLSGENLTRWSLALEALVFVCVLLLAVRIPAEVERNRAVLLEHRRVVLQIHAAETDAEKRRVAREFLERERTRNGDLR